MCGRTSLAAAQGTIETRFDAAFESDWTPRYNIAPGGDHPVILDSEPESIESIHWGLIPSWATDESIGNRLINARAETIDEKRSFRESFQSRRCLVLADGFYEWHQQPGGSQPYRIVREDGDPFAMAGIWDVWGTNGNAIRSCSIITTEANDVLEPIHDRMPVLFEPDVERNWLTSDPGPAKELLAPIDPASIRAYPVSKRVNDPSHDDPSLLEEVVGFDQTGLGDF